MTTFLIIATPIVLLWLLTGNLFRKHVEDLYKTHYMFRYGMPPKWLLLAGGPVWGIYEILKWKKYDKRISELGNTTKELSGFFAQADLHLGRMISGSKSGYLMDKTRLNVRCEPVFNANIISEYYNGKIWHGDLDLIPDGDALQTIANNIGSIAILRESDARFDNEGITWKAAQEKAVKIYKKK